MERSEKNMMFQQDESSTLKTIKGYMFGIMLFYILCYKVHTDITVYNRWDMYSDISSWLLLKYEKQCLIYRSFRI